MSDDQTLLKWARLSGEERTAFRTRCAELYEQGGLSVREIVSQTGRSYGAVHKMLREAQVRMRPRGNPTRQ